MCSTKVSGVFAGVQMGERSLAEREEKVSVSGEEEFHLIGDIPYST